MDLISKIYETVDELLYKENGLLIKYHLKQGLDLLALDKLYNQLEELKILIGTQEFIPKKIAFLLIQILPALYADLDLYNDNQDIAGSYRDFFYKLDTALQMCLNPDRNDPWFNTPLKE